MDAKFKRPPEGLSDRRNRIYLDNNATTPLLPEALEIMIKAYSRFWGNPSGQYAEGVAARDGLEWARKVFANLMNVLPETVYFTSCGTESNNLILRGVMNGGSHKGRDTIVTSSVEHSSIMKTADFCGFKHIMVPVDRRGYINESAYANILQSNKNRIGLVSVIMGQNEVGTMQHITALVRAARSILGPSVPFHTDATQVMGKYYVEPETLGVDLLTGSAHKFNGPRGCGILYAKKGVLTPSAIPMSGGGQERGCRSGTENVAAIMGAAVAFKHALGDVSKWERRRARVKSIRDMMLSAFVRHIPGVIINGDPQNGLYNTLSISVPGGHGHAITKYLDKELGIAVGSGSACSKGKGSEVLVAMYGHNEQSEKIMHGTIRVSIGYMNTVSECQEAVEGIIRAVRVTNEMAQRSISEMASVDSGGGK